MKMKIIKKNQLAILVIALMLITAGYLNYDTNSNNKNITAGANLEESVNLGALGDAELVNTDVTEEDKEEKSPVTNTTNANISNVDTKKENDNKNTSNDYFGSSKLERNMMYSQMISRYQEIIASSSQSPEQKQIAGEEINKINSLQNAIMITENLLTSKGFEQNIIFVNGPSVNVIIGKESLAPEEVAQIQNIASRELVAEMENIHIAVK